MDQSRTQGEAYQCKGFPHLSRRQLRRGQDDFSRYCIGHLLLAIFSFGVHLALNLQRYDSFFFYIGLEIHNTTRSCTLFLVMSFSTGFFSLEILTMPHCTLGRSLLEGFRIRVGRYQGRVCFLVALLVCFFCFLIISKLFQRRFNKKVNLLISLFFSDMCQLCWDTFIKQFSSIQRNNNKNTNEGEISSSSFFLFFVG